jgi:DNA-binding transcriptional MerR regulator
MRIAELSRRAGVSVPAIKFYIREGMLPRGERTRPNQARYTEAHLARLALIGTLQAAGLSLATIKQALRAMDGMTGDTPDFMAIAVGALAQPPDGAADPALRERAERLLGTVIEHRGWDVVPGSPVWEAAVTACAGVLRIWPAALSTDGLDRYAAVAEETAAFELPDEWNPTRTPAEALKYVVLGTVLFEPVILALRRLAHVDRGNKLRARRLQL